MSTAIHVIPEPLPTTSETRFAAYLLADYLERLGVEVVFGLTGHTVIAMLDALGRSRIRYVSTRHEQVAAHAADGYARASGKPGVLLTHLGPGLTNAATGVANAALDSIPHGGDRRRRAVVLPRPPSAPGDQPSSGRGPVPDLPPVLQARLPRRQRRAICRGSWNARSISRRPAVPDRCWWTCRWMSSRPACRWTPSTRCRRKSRVRPSTRRRRSGLSRRSPSAERPVLYAGGGVLSARAAAELMALAEALELPSRAHADGQGRRARGSPAAARHDRLLGHADRQREVPDRRSSSWRSARGSRKRTRARGIRASRSTSRRRA